VTFLTCCSRREILRTVGKIITVTGRGFVLVQQVIHTFPTRHSRQSQADNLVVLASDQVDHLVATASYQVDHLVVTVRYEVDDLAMPAGDQIVKAKVLVVVTLGGGEKDGFTEIWVVAIYTKLIPFLNVFIEQ